MTAQEKFDEAIRVLKESIDKKDEPIHIPPQHHSMLVSLDQFNKWVDMGVCDKDGKNFDWNKLKF